MFFPLNILLKKYTFVSSRPFMFQLSATGVPVVGRIKYTAKFHQVRNVYFFCFDTVCVYEREVSR